MTQKNSERGQKARKSGRNFELKVRHDLEEQGWNICKYLNKPDYEKDKVVPAKNKWNPYRKTFTLGVGFPDFICYRKEIYQWSIMGVEAKSAKYLDKEEKKMCNWYLEHNIFDQILIVYKDKAGHIQYYEYEVK